MRREGLRSRGIMEWMRWIRLGWLWQKKKLKRRSLMLILN